MPLSPNDMERLLKAIDRNTAALLTVAVSTAHKGKPAFVPKQTELTVIEGIYDSFLRVAREGELGESDE